MIGYMVLVPRGRSRQKPDSNTTHELHGLPHPTVFRTLHNAFRASGPYGYVLILDLALLPVLSLHAVEPKVQKAILAGWAKRMMVGFGEWDAEREVWRNDTGATISLADITYSAAITADDVEAGDLYAQHQVAERQMLIWGERTAKLAELLKNA